MTNGTSNVTHVYDKLGLMNIALGVNAEKNGITYHSIIYKNLSIRGLFVYLIGQTVSERDQLKPYNATAVRYLPNKNNLRKERHSLCHSLRS